MVSDTDDTRLWGRREDKEMTQDDHLCSRRSRCRWSRIRYRQARHEPSILMLSMKKLLFILLAFAYPISAYMAAGVIDSSDI